MYRWTRRLASCTAVALVMSPALAWAQVPAGEGMSQSPLTFVVLLAGLALLPFLLIMVTSFVKIAVVLSLLRQAIGAQQVPPNQVVTGLAIILSIFVMAPVAQKSWETTLEPFLNEVEASGEDLDVAKVRKVGTEAVAPLKAWLLRHADEEERSLLFEMALELRDEAQRKSLSDTDLVVVIPAFVITELKEAFVIGFMLFVPFIVVDMVVANILLSLGMHMLSPTTISLPFKLLLFVLVDGWGLVIRGLIIGYIV